MERLDAITRRVLQDLRDRMDGKAGEGVEPPPASGARGRSRALGEGPDAVLKPLRPNTLPDSRRDKVQRGESRQGGFDL